MEVEREAALHPPFHRVSTWPVEVPAHVATRGWWQVGIGKGTTRRPIPMHPRNRPAPIRKETT